MIRKNKGYIMMIIGILLPLYSLTSITYNELKSAYDYKRYNETKISEDEKNSIEKSTKEYNASVNSTYRGIIDPFTYSDYSSNYGAKILKNKDVFGYLQIPKIDLSKPILLDSTQENLSKGLAHVDGTNLPIGGDDTRCVIAGHRGWYKDIMFLNVDSLESGDKVYLTTILGNTLSYTVRDKEIISPYEWEKLMPKMGEDILTLLTCDRVTPNAPYRLIINAIRDKDYDNKSDIKSKIIKNNPQKASSVLIVKYSIYGITLFLWIVILFLIIKIIKNIVKNKISNKK